MRDDDERRNRGSAKSHLNGLTERVDLLESLLRERNAAAVPASPNVSSVPSRHAIVDAGSHVPSDAGLVRPPSCTPTTSSIRRPPEQTERYAGNDSVLKRLLSTGTEIQHDEPTGSVSFYGPVANCHVLASAVAGGSDRTDAVARRENRAQAAIRTLPLDTHEYLMALFWQHHNDVLFTVHQEAFARDRHAGRLRHYSALLHLSMLAMGYRFADKTRPDICSITQTMRQSTLHLEVKAILADGLDDLSGIPSTAALLLLGDLELGAGRLEAAWLYTGMALRLCVGSGLHMVDDVAIEDRSLDQKVRLATLRACFVADRFWSLFLGRPIFLKLTPDFHTQRAHAFTRSDTANSSTTLSMRINDAILSLMNIAGRLVDDVEGHGTLPPGNYEDRHHRPYFRMAALDRELRAWLVNLPEKLQSSRDNLASGPYSLYLLHQQYYALLIMLHRPFASYDTDQPFTEDDQGGLDFHFQRASRDICLKSALAMASLFRQHRQRFHGKRTFRMGMQQAGVGATALIAAMSSQQELDRSQAVQCWSILRTALTDMASAFRPAEEMITVLDAAMSEVHAKSARRDPVRQGHAPSASAKQGDNDIPSSFRCKGIPSSERSAAAAFSSLQTQTATQPDSSVIDVEKASDQTLPSFAFHSAQDFFAETHPPIGVDCSDPQGLPSNAGADEWEFESINSMIGVAGLAEGDLMDLLLNFDPTQQTQDDNNS